LQPGCAGHDNALVEDGCVDQDDEFRYKNRARRVTSEHRRVLECGCRIPVDDEATADHDRRSNPSIIWASLQ